MSGRKTAEILGVAADTNDEIGIFLGMLLSVQKLLAAYAGDLKLHTALLKISVYQSGKTYGQQT